jgi:DNA-directed RNA polymerase specialized sigma24 family protein
MRDTSDPEDVMVVLARYASGHELAFDELYDRYRDPMVRIANRIIARQHLRDVCIDGEMAVDKAFLNLRAAKDHGDLVKVESAGALFRLLELYLSHEIGHERARAQASKRGGQRAISIHLDHCDPDVLESLIAPAESPEDLVSAREEFERLRDLLHDAVRGRILAMRYDRYTVDEICTRVKRNPRAVRREIAAIRRAYERMHGKAH